VPSGYHNVGYLSRVLRFWWYNNTRMVMRNDPYRLIGEKIKILRERQGETQSDLARLLGYEAATIGRYETGDRKITIPDLEKIADHYGVPVAYFLGRDTEEDRNAAQLKRLADQAEGFREEIARLAGEVTPYHGDWVWLPLIGQVPAGYPEWQDEDETDIFYPCAAEQIRDGKGAYALRVKGNSMLNCGISDGDIIFVDSKSQAMPGDVIVARKGDEAVLRIYKEDSKGPYLQAGNEGYPILRLKEAEILGVVMGSYRRKPRLAPE